MVLYDQFCFTGPKPPPFIHLVKHMLSISAHSASCKRLFSVFGNILTKLQNHLGINNMVMLISRYISVMSMHTSRQKNDSNNYFKFTQPKKWLLPHLQYHLAPLIAHDHNLLSTHHFHTWFGDIGRQ